MALTERITLTHSVRIAATAEAVWDFFEHLDDNYLAWHPQDHVSCRWTKGRPHQVGSVVQAVERLGGRTWTIRMTCVEVDLPRRIEYRTGFPLSLVHPSSTYQVALAGPGAVRFTAVDRFRFPKVLRRALSPLLEATERHIREEGDNLKRLLEAPAGPS